MTKLLLSSGGSSAVALKPLSLLRRSLLGIGTASILLGSFSLAQAATQSVSLAWNTSTDPSVVGYNVNYGTSSGSYTQTLNAGSTASATVSSLAAGQTYYFVVTARNAAAQNSLVSNQVSFVTTAAPTPTPVPPTPTPSPTPKISPTPTPVPPTPTPSPTPKTSPTPTPTPVPPSPTPSPTPKTSPTPTPSSASTLFSPKDVPTIASVDNTNSLEVGVRFQSAVPGTVTAIRFYKSAKNIGSHIGNLWSAAGKLLGSVTFTNETASGWQQATLATPIALSAATSYVVSYHTSGFYSADYNFFATAFSNGPLTAAASSSGAGNGLYIYGQTSSFPTTSSKSANYWVDLAFLPSSVQPAPASTLAIDTKAFGDQGSSSATASTAPFSTSAANELLLAYIATDYSSGANTSVTSVTGAGLNWVRVVRTNTQAGTSEIWRALATSALSNVTVSATLSQSVASSITVTSFKGVDLTGTNGSGAIGAIGSGNASAGAPSASLVTTRNNSWVVGVGNDYDNAIARTPASGQTLVHQNFSPVGDTYWVQMLNSPTPSTGSSVSLSDSAPASDRFNLSLCEILPALQAK
jgi:outer membrane biosynthesis protein TonB